MFNYLQRVFTSTQNIGKHWYSMDYATIPELYMVNTRATLWFDIVFDFLPSQRDGFRCHSFTIRDVLALKVFVRLNSIFLVFSPAFLSWPARHISPTIWPPRIEEMVLIKITVHTLISYVPIFIITCPGGRMGGNCDIPPVNCHLVNDQPPISRVVQTAIVHNCHCLQGRLLPPLG